MAVSFEDQEFVLKDVTERFEKLKIPYMLSGSMAMVSYAMMRMTNDIDIVIEAKSTDAEKIIKEFEPDYYVPQNRVKDAIYRGNMFNLLHQEKIVKIDCVLRKDNEFQKLAFSNRKKIRFTDFDIWTISRDDLILSKLNWAKKSRSEMQMRDVANIIRNGYNKEYIEFWAEKLGVKDLLEECYKLLEINYVDGHDS
ncbi:MAG TPA: hypothetical protein PKY59_25290 [Pyrinomonadaceae bacterium]|nr:hypothetical protein [Pyrinomonadaceae bacterium]